MVIEFKPEPFTDFNRQENRSAMEEALKKVGAQLGREIPNLVDGEECRSSEKFNSINPSEKDQVIAVHQRSSAVDADRAVRAAYAAFPRWSAIPPEERAAVLFRAAHMARKRRLDLAAWQVYEVGKNWVEADADVAEAIDYMEFYAREMLRYSERQPLTPIPGEVNDLVYLPLGVVAVIPPWNFPFAILAGMSLAALVTGNTVVIKPSSDSPSIGYQFVKLMLEAGVAPGAINFVTGSGATVGTSLVEHPLTRMVAFTGSMEAGIEINQRAAVVRAGQIWLKRVIAEMGGKDAIVVDSEADLEDAANAVVASAYGFQGQKCSACSRLIVDSAVAQDLTERVVEKTRALKIGPAMDNYPVGPVINGNAEKKILEYIEKGKSESTLVHGGKKLDGWNGFFIVPTIFTDVTPDSVMAQEEIFGPVLAVIRANDLDEAIRIHNGTRYGLTGSFFSRNREKIARAKRELHCGNLYINRKCTGALVGVHPFGGFNMSGTDSKAGGRDYLLLFMQAKAISEKVG
ncbi:MAG: L-glutamate gamma-semialdehyde dehydrogenase [bacterium JZ-2024 1]